MNGKKIELIFFHLLYVCWAGLGWVCVCGMKIVTAKRKKIISTLFIRIYIWDRERHTHATHSHSRTRQKNNENNSIEMDSISHCTARQWTKCRLYFFFVPSCCVMVMDGVGRACIVWARIRCSGMKTWFSLRWWFGHCVLSLSVCVCVVTVDGYRILRCW